MFVEKLQLSAPPSFYKKSLAIANGNSQQRCMFESPVKQSLSQSPKGARRPTTNFFSVLLILIKGHDLSRSAIAVSAKNRKFCLPTFHFAPSVGMTPIEYMESSRILKLESSGQPTLKIW